MIFTVFTKATQHSKSATSGLANVKLQLNQSEDKKAKLEEELKVNSST